MDPKIKKIIAQEGIMVFFLAMLDFIASSPVTPASYGIITTVTREGTTG